jgi:hypothetical protein
VLPGVHRQQAECRLLRQQLTLAPFALATLTVLSELPPSTTRISDTPLPRTLQEQQHSNARVNQAMLHDCGCARSSR